MIISLLSGSIWLILIRLGGFHFSHINSPSFLRYPPVWSFAFLGTALYIWLVTSIIPFNQFGVKHNSNSELLIYLGSMLFGMMFVGILDAYRKRHGYLVKIQNKGIEFEGDPRNLTEDTNLMIRWLEEEMPIQHPSQDLFGLTAIAKRITRILLGKQMKTVGVVGAYGSGKSSLLNLIAYYLHYSRKTVSTNVENGFNGDVLICHVDGWGRIKGSIAQQILNIAVGRLSDVVDCLSVITVPAKYREALSGTKTPFGSTLATLLNSDEDPVTTLERLDRILLALNKRLVIFLEDLDRNTADAVIRDEMPALLDRLHNLGNVSFVFAIGTEQQYSNILVRICEHVETLA